MAEGQPTRRTQTESSFTMDDTLSDISSSKDTNEFIRRGGLHPREAYETYQRLQSDYDELLTKYAQAENTIDQLRIGAKLNLYSDLPPPQQSTIVSASRGKHPHLFSFPRVNQANLSQPVDRIIDRSASGITSERSVISRTPESGLLTPEVKADGIRTALTFKLTTFKENVEDLQSHVTDGEWGESELRELQDICDHLTRQHVEMKQQLILAKQLERQGSSPDVIESVDDEFLHEDCLEGQLYRLGLRLDEINEQILENLHQIPSNSERTTYDNDRNTNVPKPPMKKQHTDPELASLMNRLRSVKDSAKNDDILSRSGKSLEDVNDLADKTDFTLGPLSDDSDQDNSKKRDPTNSAIDLQESGYYASETMSVSQGDANSEPISSHYLSNSATGLQHPLRGGGTGDHDASFDQQSTVSSPERERPLSDTSIDSIPNPRRSKIPSQRSRANTTNDDVTNPSSYYPEYSPAPNSIERSPPQATSSILTEQTRHESRPQREDSRISNSSGKRSRAGTTESILSRDRGSTSRNTKAQPVNSHVDILRTEHDNPAHHVTPPSHYNVYDVHAGSLESSPRHDSKSAGQRKNGHQRISLSSADSRMSTPLFRPHPGEKPKETRRDSKSRPPTAETERGFDSGFFGSEGSRGSRFARALEVQSLYDQNKIRHPSLREQTLSESEEERFHRPSTQIPARSASKFRDTRRRRSYLQSLSESEEDRVLETSPSKTSIRSSANQRERRGHRHTPTFPVSRSDNERTRRLDESLRRPLSSPNLVEQPADRRTDERPRSNKTPLRPDTLRKGLADIEHPARIGPRSDHDTRPMDKQSVRSYPGLDRESVRSGRRSRRDDDDSSVYSERKYKRYPVDKLREELQRLRIQLDDEARARSLQSQLYGDLQRKHDNLEQQIARKNAEQQMTNMYEDLQKKYDELTRRVGTTQQPRDAAPKPGDDLRRRLEELSFDVDTLKSRGNEPSPAAVQFLCPFCGGCRGHHHGSYYYPGFSGPRGALPTGEHAGNLIGHEIGTQTHYVDVPQRTRYPATPQATSTPYYTGIVGTPYLHLHSNTYPGGVPTGTPIHHVHHLPDNRSRDRVDYDGESSDEDDRNRPRRRNSSYRRRTREPYHEDELDSRRLHLSLDEANNAARRMQRISKKMLNSVASDLIRSGQR